MLITTTTEEPKKVEKKMLIYKNRAGKRLPSVTTIISKNLGWNKDVLMGWQNKMWEQGKDPRKVRDDAADLGSLVHAHIEAHTYGKMVDPTVEAKYTFEQIAIAQRGLEMYKQKIVDAGIEWIQAELPLISEDHQYGGTLDGYGKMNGIMSLGDIKTCKYVYPDHIIQLGAYDNLLIENKICTPEQYFIVHVNKDVLVADDDLVEIITIPMEQVKLGFEVFKTLRWMHLQEKELKLK